MGPLGGVGTVKAPTGSVRSLEEPPAVPEKDGALSPADGFRKKTGEAVDSSMIEAKLSTMAAVPSAVWPCRTVSPQTLDPEP